MPATLLVLLSIGSAQFGGAFARTLFDDLGAAGVTVLRLGIAALLLAVATRPRLSTWSPAGWRAAALLGVFLAGLNLNSYLALRTVPLGVVVTVSFAGPLLLALVQTRRPVDGAWALLAAAGVALLGLERAGDSASLGGLLLAFCAGLCGAGYIVSSARLGGAVPGTGGLTVALAVGFLLALPFGAAGASAVAGHPALLLGGAVVAVLSSVVPAGLELTVLRRMPTRVFGILMSLQPAGAAIAGRLVLRQRLGPVELAALMLVTLAAVGVSRSSPPPSGKSAARQAPDGQDRPA